MTYKSMTFMYALRLDVETEALPNSMMFSNNVVDKTSEKD